MLRATCTLDPLETDLTTLCDAERISHLPLLFAVISGGCRSTVGNDAVEAFDAIPEREGMVMQCGWDGCNLGFNTKRALAQHLGDDHADNAQFRLGCHWVDCHKYALPVTRRSNLMSHISTHISGVTYTSLTDGGAEASMKRSASAGDGYGSRLSKRGRVSADTDPEIMTPTAAGTAAGAASAAATVAAATAAAKAGTAARLSTGQATAATEAASSMAAQKLALSAGNRGSTYRNVFPTKAAVPPPVHGAAERAPVLTETDKHIVRQKIINAATLQDQITDAGTRCCPLLIASYPNRVREVVDPPPWHPN
jgi:hypothetical protein